MRVKNLHKHFPDKGEYYDAVDDLSLTLYSDEVLACNCRKSGCGKSTLANNYHGFA